MRTSNPALNDKAFRDASGYDVSDYERDASRSSLMTLDGTVMKTFILTAILVATAAVSWRITGQNFDAEAPAAGQNIAPLLIFGGAIAGLIFAIITIFKPNISPYTTPLYAAAEGLFLGGISAMYNAAYEGIVLQAVLLTVAVLVSLLMAYRSGLIKATENFKLGVVAATGAVALVYLVSMVLRFFDMNIPMIHDNGIVGIGFSLVVVVIASLNLVLDFDFIESGVERGAPKYMEWYGAFGLLVTLVWLYLEILRLLAKLRSRD